MRKFKLKTKTKNMLLIVLGCVFIFGAIFGIFAMLKNNENNTTKTINPAYAVGGLNSNGAYVETKESIYTKNAFECKGLKVIPEFTSTIKYQIYFYNSNDKFVKNSNLLSTKFEEDLTFGIVKCRIVIIPNEDSNIAWYEINHYAKQLKIQIDKDQTNTISENMFEFGHSGNLTDTYGVYGDSNWQSSSKGVDVSCCSKVIIKGSDFSSLSYSLFKADGTRLVSESIVIDNLKTDNSGVQYFEIDMSKHNDANIFQLCYKNDATFELRLYA